MFVRTDLPLEVQMVQSNHATFEMAKRLSSPSEEIPFLVLIGLPDKAALFRVISKLKSHDIPHTSYYEPDDDLGLTAVATVPLMQEQRRVLSKYCLWKYVPAPPAPDSPERQVAP